MGGIIMQSQLLSEMSNKKLQDEMRRCQNSAKIAIENGVTNEYQVYEQRYFLAKSYLTDPANIEAGITYGIETTTDLFIVDYLDGIMAYGKVLGTKENRAFPIGKLVPLDFSRDSQHP